MTEALVTAVVLLWIVVIALVAYSLGNFATWWGINIREAKGYAPILRVGLDGNGRFLHK